MDALDVSQQQLVARMVEALVEARAQVATDRQSLYDSVVRSDTGEVDEGERPAIDEYDRVLELIDEALDKAKGEA